MKQPEKWKETVNPFEIPFQNFKLEQVLGYPHARNDVFYCKGLCFGEQIFCFVKYASKPDSDIANEICAIQKLNFSFVPQIVDCDQGKFVVTKEVVGERLSYLLANTNEQSIDYMFEYGKTLAQIHSVQMDHKKVEHRKFFDLPSLEYLQQWDIEFAKPFLDNKPTQVDECFCHGDFHYANILWNERKICAVLDWELCGIGNKEFDIARAIINRPGQEFLNTAEEVNEFLRGYQSVGHCDTSKVHYYMVLVYCHFISVGNNTQYQQFVRNWLKANVT